MQMQFDSVYLCDKNSLGEKSQDGFKPEQLVTEQIASDEGGRGGWRKGKMKGEGREDRWKWKGRRGRKVDRRRESGWIGEEGRQEGRRNLKGGGGASSGHSIFSILKLYVSYSYPLV